MGRPVRTTALQKGIGWRTHRPRLRERLHQLHALGVNLDEGQQVPGLDRLEQLDHLGCGGRAGLSGVLVVHILGIDELLPHRPVPEDRNSASNSEFGRSARTTHMSLDGVGFGEGQGRFPSMISLKLLFPTFLASWARTENVSQPHFITFASLSAFPPPHQEFRSPQLVQLHGLDAGDVDPHLSVDAGALDAGQDPKVGGQPFGI